MALKFDTKKVTDDSGFDSSYSGGGSSDSSSSGDGGSSSGGGGSGVSCEGWDCFIEITTYFVVFGVVGGIIGYIFLKNYEKNSIASNNQRIGLTEDYIKTIIPEFNYEEFINERVVDYLNIQYAWMSFKYDLLREKTTDELYNQYEMQLNTLSSKGQKNVMKAFQYKDSKITDVKNNNGLYEVTMELTISFYDYIEENGKVVKGNDSSKITMHYELVFVSSSDDNMIKNCPSCGAELSDSTSQVCPYCKAVIDRKGNKWVLSKKKALWQKKSIEY
jgi:preprotein translocase subunit SecG/predicted RNA-binding Zn-ribbon protein involved in translation (DUF1610 family)